MIDSLPPASILILGALFVPFVYIRYFAMPNTQDT